MEVFWMVVQIPYDFLIPCIPLINQKTIWIRTSIIRIIWDILRNIPHFYLSICSCCEDKVNVSFTFLWLLIPCYCEDCSPVLPESYSWFCVIAIVIFHNMFEIPYFNQAILTYRGKKTWARRHEKLSDSIEVRS